MPLISAAVPVHRPDTPLAAATHRHLLHSAPAMTRPSTYACAGVLPTPVANILPRTFGCAPRTTITSCESHRTTLERKYEVPGGLSAGHCDMTRWLSRPTVRLPHLSRFSHSSTHLLCRRSSAVMWTFRDLAARPTSSALTVNTFVSMTLFTRFPRPQHASVMLQVSRSLRMA